jgi:hypothetical protein
MHIPQAGNDEETFAVDVRGVTRRLFFRFGVDDASDAIAVDGNGLIGLKCAGAHVDYGDVT